MTNSIRTDIHVASFNELPAFIRNKVNSDPTQATRFKEQIVSDLARQGFHYSGYLDDSGGYMILVGDFPAPVVVVPPEETPSTPEPVAPPAPTTNVTVVENITNNTTNVNSDRGEIDIAVSGTRNLTEAESANVIWRVSGSGDLYVFEPDNLAGSYFRYVEVAAFSTIVFRVDGGSYSVSTSETGRKGLLAIMPAIITGSL